MSFVLQLGVLSCVGGVGGLQHGRIKDGLTVENKRVQRTMNTFF